MNSNSPFRPRIVGPCLSKSLARSPVVVLTGARQTGKSRLVTEPPIGRGRTYLTMDDLDIQERAVKEPEFLLRTAPRVTLDEVQRVPSLLLAIKREVDRNRKAGRFLLTGSANLLLMRGVSESLAGRAVYLHLGPMTESEKNGRPEPGPWDSLLKAATAKEAEERLLDAGKKGRGGEAAPRAPDWPERVLVGGYPVSVLASDVPERLEWFEGYLRTYLERDLHDVAAIDALVDFRRLMKLAALRIGQILNQSELARDAGLSQPTAHRYLNLLETTFQIVRLPPYAVSRTKRIVKSPRLYWTDSGLGAHLAGIGSEEALRAYPRAGALVENLILQQLLAWRETVLPRPEILWWRTVAGEEVDFVIESGSRVFPMEIKLGDRIRMEDEKNLRIFLGEHPGVAPFGVVLYGGREVRRLSERILAVPLSRAW